jgi:S1-C subfamily serine protease
MLCAALVSLAALQGLAGEGRRHATAVERYGLGGHVQPIGLHHGFHVTSVQPGSPAEQDRLRPHDVIVKVDGELIRSLEHLQTLLTDAYEDDGKVTLTVLKAGSLEHHVLNGNVRGRDESRTARSTDDTRR